MRLWMKVTTDKYELPLAVAESASELAKMLGIKATTIRSATCDARHGRRNTPYRVVEIEEGE